MIGVPLANLLYLTVTGTLANSEDPDKMQHNAAFYQDQGLHCLLSLKRVNKAARKNKICMLLSKIIHNFQY